MLGAPMEGGAMHVVLQADMDGVAQITDYRECFPVYPAYWQTGRRRMTADVAAAAEGLFDGGASAVTIRNSHGAGWPNLVPEDLPSRAVVAEGGFGAPRSEAAFDASFQVGRHARCGTPDGFLSHTGVFDFRITVDGRPVTESHAIAGAWSVGVPLLGIVGDAALAPELDGTLTGTPFLAVKRSTSRRETAPVHADPAASAEAIRAFARDCARRWRERRAPRLPASFTVELSMDPAAADRVAGTHGLVRVSPAVLRLQATDWRAEAGPAVGAAARAAAAALLADLAPLDLASEETAWRQPSGPFEKVRRAFDDFAAADYAAWRTD
jgi:D-amino peptidase